MNPNTASIQWECRIPLLTNRFIWYDTAKALLITGVIAYAGMACAFLFQGEPELLLPLLGAIAVAIGALAVLLILAMLLMRNRSPARFTVDERGAGYEATSAATAAAGDAMIVAGALAAKPGVAGAGLIGRAQRAESIRWHEVCRVNEHPSARVITLMNSWRAVLRLYCTAENYDAVAALVRQGAARGAEARARKADRPVPSSGVRIGAVLASLIALAAGAAMALSALPVNPAWGIVAAVLVAVSCWVAPIRRLAGAIALLCILAALAQTVSQGFKVHHLTGLEAVLANEYRDGRLLTEVDRTGFARLSKRQVRMQAIAGIGTLVLLVMAAQRTFGRTRPVAAADQTPAAATADRTPEDQDATTACPLCATVNPADARFCKACGAPFPKPPA